MIGKKMKKILSGVSSVVFVANIMLGNMALVAKAEAPWTAKYDFGNGAVETGYTQVLPTDAYSATKGYGFLRTKGEETNINIDGIKRSVADLVAGGNTNTDKLNGDYLEAVDPEGFDPTTGDMPMSFAVRVPTQNQTYDVKVVIGREDKDMKLSLSTEKKHYLIYDEIVPKGTYITKEFTVSVQNQNYKGDGAFSDTTVAIAAWGDNVCINSIEITENPNRNTIWMLGDSTMGDCIGYSPMRNFDGMASYGAGMSKYIGLGYGIANFSQGGLNSTDMARSYFSQFSGRIKPGDYVIMAAGHNDGARPTDGSSWYYQDNFRSVVDATIAKGATPILASPIERTSTYSNGSYQVTLGQYRDGTKEVADEKGVPYIDLNTLTNTEYNKVGNPGAQYFMWNGWSYSSTKAAYVFTSDRTHPSPRGTDMITGNFAKEVKRLVNENNAKAEQDRSAAVNALMPLFNSLNNEEIHYPSQEFMKDGSDAIKVPVDNSNFIKPAPTVDTLAFPLSVKSVDVIIDDNEDKIIKTISVQKDEALAEYGHAIVAFYDKNGALIKIVKKNTDPTIGAGSLEVIDYNEYLPEGTDSFKVFVFDGLLFEPANPERPLNGRPVSLPYVYNQFDRFIFENEDFAKYDMLVGDDIVTASNGVWTYEASSSPLQIFKYGKDDNGNGFANFQGGPSGSYWFGAKFATKKIVDGKVYFNANMRVNANKSTISLTSGGSWKNYLPGVSFSLDSTTGNVTAGGISIPSVITKGNWYNVTYIVDLTKKTNEMTVKDLATGQIYTGNGTLASVPTEIASILVSNNSTVFNFDINNITIARLRDPIPAIPYTTTFTVKDNEGVIIPNAIITINGTTARGDVVTDKVINANGSGFATTTMVNGDYTYLVTAAGHNPLINQTLTISKTNKDVSVTMEKSTAPKYTVSFNAVDFDGVAIADTVVSIVDTKYNLPVIANQDKTFSLENGEYSYTIEKTGYMTQTGIFTVADGEKIVDVSMPMPYLYEDFTTTTGNWGMTNTVSGTTGTAAVSGGLLKINLDSNKGATELVKTFDTNISSLTKMHVSFDWKPNTDPTRGRNSFLLLKDAEDKIIFGLQQNKVETYSIDGGATWVNFGKSQSIWYNVDLVMDLTTGSVNVTISQDGVKLVDNVSFATTSTSLAKLTAKTGYSLAPMDLDNFVIYQSK